MGKNKPKGNDTHFEGKGTIIAFSQVE